MKLKNLVAVVTGAGGDLGRAIAAEFAAEGAKVIVNDRDPAGAERTAAEIRTAGGEAAAAAADVSSFPEVKKLMEEAVRVYGTVDILVNNAGVNRDAFIGKMTEEHWDTVIDVNLKGAFNTIKAVMDIMAPKNAGKIINITSICGQFGNIGQANYCASKGGLAGLTRCMAKEAARFNINVNALAPGFIEAGLTLTTPEKVREKVFKDIPLGRAGTPRDVARACVFLASDDAGYITGQELSVNGGWYMK